MTLLKVCSLLFMVALFSVRFLASNKDVQKKSEHCGEGSAPFTDDESRDPDLTDACLLRIRWRSQRRDRESPWKLQSEVMIQISRPASLPADIPPGSFWPTCFGSWPTQATIECRSGGHLSDAVVRDGVNYSEWLASFSGTWCDWTCPPVSARASASPRSIGFLFWS